MRQGNGGQDNVPPVVSRPVQVSVVIPIIIIGVKTITVAVSLVLERLRLLFDIVIELVLLRRAPEEQFVLFDR